MHRSGSWRGTQLGIGEADITTGPAPRSQHTFRMGVATETALPRPHLPGEKSIQGSTMPRPQQAQHRGGRNETNVPSPREQSPGTALTTACYWQLYGQRPATAPAVVGSGDRQGAFRFNSLFG